MLSLKATLRLAQVRHHTIEYSRRTNAAIGTIVHPKATIFAIAGPIVIGSGCIIEEGAIIVNRYVDDLKAILELISLQAKRGYEDW